MTDLAAFEQLQQAAQSDGVSAALDNLAERFRSEGNYPGVFEARLMKARLELGLPLVLNGPPDGAEEDVRKGYEQAQIDAARETGQLFLADGEIYRAWPYFRALGDKAPVIAALRVHDLRAANATQRPAGPSVGDV